MNAASDLRLILKGLESAEFAIDLLEKELQSRYETIKELADVLEKQTELVGRLLTIVDCCEQDIGCESPDKIWPILGPVHDAAGKALDKLKETDK